MCFSAVALLCLHCPLVRCGLALFIPWWKTTLNNGGWVVLRLQLGPLQVQYGAPRYYFSFQFPKTTWRWLAAANTMMEKGQPNYSPRCSHSLGLMLIFTVCLHHSPRGPHSTCVPTSGPNRNPDAIGQCFRCGWDPWWQGTPDCRTRRSNNNSHSKSRKARTHWGCPWVSENCYTGFCFQFLPLIGSFCWRAIVCYTLHRFPIKQSK